MHDNDTITGYSSAAGTLTWSSFRGPVVCSTCMDYSHTAAVFIRLEDAPNFDGPPGFRFQSIYITAYLGIQLTNSVEHAGGPDW